MRSLMIPVVSLIMMAYKITDSRLYQSFIDHLPVHKFPALTPDIHYEAAYSFEFGWSPATRVPAFIANFDWYMANPKMPMVKKLSDPRSVYAVPLTMSGHITRDIDQIVLDILQAAEKNFDRNTRNRTLIFSDDISILEVLGNNRSQCLDTYFKLRQWFDLIFFTATDIDIDGIKTFPVGLSEEYLRPGLPHHRIANKAWLAIQAAHVGNKPLAVLLPCKRYVPARDQFVGTYTRTNRYIACEASWESARAWAGQASTMQIDVEERCIEPKLYWTELVKYRFLLTVLGKGVQTSRAIEALLVLTVPIIQRGPFVTYDDLVTLGFPIVLVDNWAEITKSKLDNWWTSYSMRLFSFRKNCLTSDAYWRIATGQLQHCQ